MLPPCCASISISAYELEGVKRRKLTHLFICKPFYTVIYVIIATKKKSQFANFSLNNETETISSEHVSRHDLTINYLLLTHTTLTQI